MDKYFWMTIDILNDPNWFFPLLGVACLIGLVWGIADYQKKQR